MLDRLRRWRRWIVLLAVLLAVRAALPEVIRRVLVAQASKALRAEVEIGDIDLSLLRGGIALNDVALRAAAVRAGGPAAPSPPAAEPVTPATHDEPSAAPAAEPQRPLIAWKRLAVAVYWLPLFHKTVRLREVALDSPRVALDRLADGQLNVMALLPQSPSEAPVVPTPEPPTPASVADTPTVEAGAAGEVTPTVPAPAAPGWGYGVDRVVLRDGGLRFRDLAVQQSEPIEIQLESIEVSDFEVHPGIYGEPAHVHVEIAHGGGVLKVDAHLKVSEGGMAVEADLDAHGLPLQNSRVYIPRVGWSALQGELDAALAYRFDPGTQHDVRGTLTVRDLAVHVPNIEAPALGWQNLTVKVDPIDLVAHRAAVTDIQLTGASLLVRPHGGDPLPLLSAVAQPGSAPGAPNPRAAAVESQPGQAPPAPNPEAAPWRWSVAGLRMTDAQVHLLGSATPVDVGVTLGLTDLAGDGAHPAHVDLALAVGNGSVHIDGALRISPPGFAGKARTTDLSLPEIVTVAGVLPPDVLHSARLATDLTVEAGLSVPEAPAGPLPPSDVRVSGHLSIAEPQLLQAGPQGFAANAGAIDLTLSALRLPGVLSSGDSAAGPAGTAPQLLHLESRLALTDFHLEGSDPKVFAIGARSLELPITAVDLPGRGGDPAAQPIRVALGALRLGNPTVQLTRTPEGLVLPQLAVGAPAPAAASSPPPPPQPVAEGRPTPRVEISVDALRLTGGRVAALDRTVKPYFAGGLSALDIDMHNLRWPPLSIGDFRGSTATPEKGTLKFTGTVIPDGGRLEVTGDQIALTPFNPYATSFSSYSIGGGTISVTTKVTTKGGRSQADTSLTLHDFDVQGGAGESVFEKQFGIPLSMALALMRDVRGDINLGIPMQVDATGGTKVDLLAVIGGALRSALVGALTSPIKLLGAVFDAGGGKMAPPAPIPFRVGRADFAAGGNEQIDRLAGVLASRPGVAVTLDAVVTTSDVRWLREQALRAAWDSQGVLATLGGLPQRGTRETIRKALEARAKDEAGDLSADDAATLTRWLDERPPIAADRMRALATDRLARTEAALREGHGIDAARITHGEPPAEASDGQPVVRVQLGSVRR